MKGTLQPKIKICCIASIDEAELAIAYGATHLGLVSKMPSGPGVISDSLISKIAKNIKPPTESVLLTSKTSVEEIINQHQLYNTSYIQIVDKIERGKYHSFKEKIPETKIIQVVHVVDETSISEAIEMSKYVDVILLDSGNPTLKTKILGGTGKVHNWELSKLIREEVNIPVYLAGGINSENVQDAISFVQPAGIDLCSGVRTDGRLDEEKLSKFFSEIKTLQK